MWVHRFRHLVAIAACLVLTASSLAEPAATQPATAPATQAAKPRFGIIVWDANKQPGARALIRDLGGNLLVNGVLKNSRAEHAGMRRGDVILRIDGQDVKTVEDVLQRVKEGTLLKLDILRKGESMTIRELPDTL